MNCVHTYNKPTTANHYLLINVTFYFQRKVLACSLLADSSIQQYSVSLNTTVGSSLVNMFRPTAFSQHLRASGAPRAQVMEEEEGQWSENKQAPSQSDRCSPPAPLGFRRGPHGRSMGVIPSAALSEEISSY